MDKQILEEKYELQKNILIEDIKVMISDLEEVLINLMEFGIFNGCGIIQSRGSKIELEIGKLQMLKTILRDIDRNI